jgi:integrase
MSASELIRMFPRAAGVLTDARARALKPGRVRQDAPDGRVPGLYLSVLPSGLKQWTLRYRTQGRQRRLVLGEYGDYPRLSLSKAREAAEKNRPQIREGADPVADRAAAKAIPVDTVGALAKDYVSKHVQVRHRRPDEEQRILNVYVLSAWRDRSVRGLTRRDVRALVEPIADRAPVMANRVLAVVRRMLNFAVRRDWIDANPASLISKPGRESSRDRVLNDDELRALWALLGRFPATHEKQAPGRRLAKYDADGKPFCPISPALAAVQKVRLLTAQRGGEVVAMRWQDLDLKRAAWWTIPGEFTKNGRPHRVPLTADVAKIIRVQCPDDEPQPDSHVFAHLGESVRDRAKKAGAALSRVLGFKFRGHDLRRTAATRMAGAGVTRQHISAVLNHVEGGPTATRVYDRYSYDVEKRAALETWAKDLSCVLAAKPKAGAAVVPIAKRAQTRRTADA